MVPANNAERMEIRPQKGPLWRARGSLNSTARALHLSVFVPRLVRRVQTLDTSSDDAQESRLVAEDRGEFPQFARRRARASKELVGSQGKCHHGTLW